MIIYIYTYGKVSPMIHILNKRTVGPRHHTAAHCDGGAETAKAAPDAASPQAGHWQGLSGSHAVYKPWEYSLYWDVLWRLPEGAPLNHPF